MNIFSPSIPYPTVHDIGLVGLYNDMKCLLISPFEDLLLFTTTRLNNNIACTRMLKTTMPCQLPCFMPHEPLYRWDPINTSWSSDSIEHRRWTSKIRTVHTANALHLSHQQMWWKLHATSEWSSSEVICILEDGQDLLANLGYETDLASSPGSNAACLARPSLRQNDQHSFPSICRKCYPQSIQQWLCTQVTAYMLLIQFRLS